MSGATGRQASTKRREEILRVTSRLLRSRGLEVSLQEIAGELGITYNALYRHFDGREDLVFQTLLRTTDLLYETLQRVAAGQGSGLEKLMAFLDEFREVSVAEETPSGVLAVVLPLEAQLALGTHLSPSRDLLIDLVRQGINDGSINRCDPLITVTWILHMLYWWPHEIESERRPDEVVDQIFKLIRKALEPEAK